jgi:hypothetical protein
MSAPEKSGHVSSNSAMRYYLSAAQWQNPGTDSCVFKDNDASLFQRFSDACEVRRKKGELPVRLSLSAAPKKNRGWLAMLPCGEHRTEIRVGRNHYAIFNSRSLEDVRVVGRL